MKRVIGLLLLMTLLMPACVVLLQGASHQRELLPVNERYNVFLPGSILKITTLEFDGIASVFYFLQSLVFIGSTFERTEVPRVRKGEWEWLHQQLDAATDLDPYFLDPYYFANAHLGWDGQRFDLVNPLLEKACHFRSWDWLVHFFVGFNYFYFLEDYERAAPFFLLAAQLPGTSPAIQTLAARTLYEGGRTEAAITFLEQMLENEEDEWTRTILLARLSGLQPLHALEVEVAAYYQKFGIKPTDIGDLLESGLIKALPVDPFGGDYYIDTDGRVRTTSNFK